MCRPMSAAKMDLRLGLSAGVLPVAFGVVVVVVVVVVVLLLLLCMLRGDEGDV